MQVALEHARASIAQGSQSFAAAARLFDARTRESAVMLYAWCRHCDDLIDGQVLGHATNEERSVHPEPFDKAQDRPVEACRQGPATDPSHETASPADLETRLLELQAKTRAACAGKPGDDPAFQALAEVVRRHGLPAQLPMELLAGFAMDARGTEYRTLADTLLYAWRVAGVVGVMMARVMGVSDARTLDRACDLGIAFQLTNIARDVLEDAANGRLYLPAGWLREEGLHGLAEVQDPGRREALARVVARLVATAEPYYQSALAGIGELPLRCAWSIATARGIYREIGRKLKRSGPSALERRVATSRGEKLWFVARGAGVALAASAIELPARPVHLFQRPF
ncbi:phytoene/squalene synthase family protein [Ramlibacter rhizophilus]|uniref:Phytoene/squalene synthase family protein n=1 Tax=Ramlibacter rhizophilus TaxID=1781167 RepID=A0A4Z0BJ47_9BURK|nr:phytoene/squalene synthase family protein [Ramlibacter rhizophilus]